MDGKESGDVNDHCPKAVQPTYRNRGRRGVGVKTPTTSD